MGGGGQTFSCLETDRGVPDPLCKKRKFQTLRSHVLHAGHIQATIYFLLVISILCLKSVD